MQRRGLVTGDPHNGYKIDTRELLPALGEQMVRELSIRQTERNPRCTVARQ